MKSGKDMSILNCAATAMLACFITVPGHELLHLLTHMIYGSKLLYYSAGAVDAIVPDYSILSPFHRIMVAGGSASLLNALVGIILLIVLMKVRMGPHVRTYHPYGRFLIRPDRWCVRGRRLGKCICSTD